MRTRTLVLVALGGLALAAIGTVLVLTSDHVDDTGPFLSLALTVGLSFLASGVIALWRRPQNRTGVLLVLVSYLWFLGALAESNNDWVFTIGVIVNSFTLGAFVHLLLAYPTGRLQSRRDLWLVVTTYVLVLLASVGQLLVDEDPDSSCPDCTSTIAVADSETAHDLVTGVAQRARARARGRRPRDRRHPLRPRQGRPPPGAGPRSRHRRARDGRPARPADRGDGLRGRRRAAVLRLPRHVRARAGGLPRRSPPQPARAQRRRRPGPRARPRRPACETRSPTRSATRRSTSSTGSPSASSSSCPTERRSWTTTARGSGTTCGGTAARGRAHPRPLARGRARARRRGRGSGRALARERTAAGRGAGAVRLSRDDRQHGAVPAHVARAGWADRQLQHRLRARERLRERRGRTPRVLLGRLHLAERARRGARTLPEEPGPSPRHVGEHVRQPARRGDGDRVVDRAAAGRVRQRPQHHLRRPRRHRAQAARDRARPRARLPQEGGRYHAEPARRRRRRGEGGRGRRQRVVREGDGLERRGDARPQLRRALPRGGSLLRRDRRRLGVQRRRPAPPALALGHTRGPRPRGRVDGDADRGHPRSRARARLRSRRDRAGAARARPPLERGAAARDDRGLAGGRARGRPRRPDRALESRRGADVRLVSGGDGRRPAPAHPGRGARAARRADDPRPLGGDLHGHRGQAPLQGRQPDRRRDLGSTDPRCVRLGDQPPGAVRGHQRPQAAGGGAPRLARPHRQGRRRGEAPAGAEPPRRRPAAARRALTLAPPRPDEGRQRPAGRRGGARVRARGARRGARRAARARPRHPPGRPHRPGPRRRARGARLAPADPGRDRDARGRAAAGRRSRRVLRDRGGARERDQVRPRVRGRTSG